MSVWTSLQDFRAWVKIEYPRIGINTVRIISFLFMPAEPFIFINLEVK
jgi:heme-degrading monooxygenase HmoA